ncbi:MAG: hypothetical protein JRN67_00475 [Nitrososphaerota archaeon]|nr:hypothetical protein [Nitrososphaerota archaeon]
MQNHNHNENHTLNSLFLPSPLTLRMNCSSSDQIDLVYQLGITLFGLLAGVAYGMFDAWIVIWQRDLISNAFHRTSGFLRQIGPAKRKTAVTLIVQ